MYEIYVRYVRLASNDMRLLQKPLLPVLWIYIRPASGEMFFFQPV